MGRTVGSRPLTKRQIRFCYDFVLDVSQPLDFNPDDISHFEGTAWLHRHTTPTGCASDDDVAGLLSKSGRQILDDVEAVKDQVVRVCILSHFAIYLSRQIQNVRIDICDDGRPQWAMGVPGLAHRKLGRCAPHLPLADADVVAY